MHLRHILHLLLFYQLRWTSSVPGTLAYTPALSMNSRIHSLRNDQVMKFRTENKIKLYGIPQHRKLLFLLYMKQDVPEDYIDASIIKETKDIFDVSEEEEMKKKSELMNAPNREHQKRISFRDTIRKLASLSLEDYKWRSALFKSNKADVQLEKSIARMTGEDPTYVRPMDASEEKIGPLGNAEKRAVEWLSDVIEEEGDRAKRIAEGDGALIRPIDASDDENDFGRPLAALERKAVQFFKRIADSETDRVVQGKLRPMELDDSKRGPLGEAERRAVEALGEITDSEKLRFEQSRARGGDVVRPIDVPGPLGEIERAALEVVKAEQQRMKDRKDLGRFVRPKDATVEGPLGKAEREAVEAIDRVKIEERDRLESIQKLLKEKRPMETDRVSPLGITEALLVGILRGPKLIKSVAYRVKELLQSENLDYDPPLQLKQSTNYSVGKDDEDIKEAI